MSQKSQKSFATVVSSTPDKHDDASKERDRSSSSLSESLNNPEKKNKQETSLSDISDIADLVPVPVDPVSVITDPAPATTDSVIINADHASVHLAESDFTRISVMIKEAIVAQVEPLVKSIVSEVTKNLNSKIDKLTLEKETLAKQVKTLSVRVSKLERESDNAEQYSRRNCLRIVGVSEDDSESTDDVIMEIASEIQADIRPYDIDRSHRVGRAPSSTEPMPTTPKAIIVKFATYRARNNFYRKRAELKGNRKFPRVYINEDFTSQRNKLFKAARKLVKDGLINSAWTYDGRVFIKDNNDVIIVVSHLSDLKEYE